MRVCTSEADTESDSENDIFLLTFAWNKAFHLLYGDRDWEVNSVFTVS